MKRHVTYATNRESATSRGVDPIISIHRSVTSSSRRQHPSEVGPHRSSQTYWRQNWRIRTFSKFAIYNPSPRQVTTQPRSLKNSFRYALFRYFRSFEQFFQFLLQFKPKGLNTGYKVHECNPGLSGSPVTQFFSNFRPFDHFSILFSFRTKGLTTGYKFMSDQG